MKKVLMLLVFFAFNKVSHAQAKDSIRSARDQIISTENQSHKIPNTTGPQKLTLKDAGNTSSKNTCCAKCSKRKKKTCKKNKLH